MGWSILGAVLANAYMVIHSLEKCGIWVPIAGSKHSKINIANLNSEDEDEQTTDASDEDLDSFSGWNTICIDTY